MQSENYLEERFALNGVQLILTSYKIGAVYHCRVASMDPGATIARSSGATAQEARDTVMQKARRRIGE